MKRVILDEGVPRNVARHLPGYDVTSVLAEGWSSVKNGKLLGLIERAHFDAFITNDKKMEAEGQLRQRTFATLLLSTNHWPSISPHVAKIADALDACEPGSVTRVDCGMFVPRRMRKP